MKYFTYLLLGAPGSGKGTQGIILGSIPGFFHISCGEVLRSIDLRSDLGKSFMEYSGRGQLAPDEMVLELWQSYIENMITLTRFKPEIDHLILDGLPRNINQAKLLQDDLYVRKIFHLSCPNRNELKQRMQRRALKDNRIDDASDEVIQKRLTVYETETKPVLQFYGQENVVTIDSTHYPYQVTREILQHIDTTRPTNGK